MGVNQQILMPGRRSWPGTRSGCIRREGRLHGKMATGETMAGDRKVSPFSGLGAVRLLQDPEEKIDA